MTHVSQINQPNSGQSGLFTRNVPAFRQVTEHTTLGTAFACSIGAAMSLVKLLGFTTLTCGCVSGRYREVGSDREVTYIEEKGTSCTQTGHLRNQPVSANRVVHGFNPSGFGRAS